MECFVCGLVIGSIGGFLLCALFAGRRLFHEDHDLW